MMTTPDTKPPSLPEYRDNPFIAALPPLWHTRETYERLRLLPLYDPSERLYADHVRPHCIMRLFRYFEPLEQHLTLADRFGMLLRQGYLGRNPALGDYQRQLQNSVARMESGNLLVKRYSVPNSAAGFALLGDSGIGKSTAMERTLAQYPQTVYHDQPFSLHQVTWLKVECPQKGGPNQLCINFFGELDRVLGGTNYLDKYGASSRTLGLAMQRMAHLASIHALGALIVDEIQHLLRTRGMDAEDILNFLVTLVNTIGVPVIVIGTQNAVAVLQGKFRQARRASGIGSMIWERMPNDKKWNHFVERLWQYQWTREFTPLDDELRTVLHEESQGIIDVVVKLFMLAQMKAIRLRVARKRPEVLDATLFRQVVTEDFQLIRPMLDACRRNDREALNAFDDLLPFRDQVARLFGSQPTYAIPDEPPPQALEISQLADRTSDIANSVRAALATLGLAPDVAELMLSEALAEHPSIDALQLVAAISEKLKASAGTPKPAKPRRAPRPEPPEWPANDLRRITNEGKQRGLTAYDALKLVGTIKALPVAA